MTEKQEIGLKTKLVSELKRYVDDNGNIKHWKISKIADGLVKNINYDALLASVNSDLKETYLKRIRTANDMIDNPDTPEEQKQRLRTKVSCYKYFVVELER